MPLDYRMLVRRSERRAHCARLRLAALLAEWQERQAHCRRLLDEIALLRQLAGAYILDGAQVDRSGLFACLRKIAITRQRGQQLRLELRQLEEDTRASEQAWQAQQAHCRLLERRLQVREGLWHTQRRSLQVRDLNGEDAELEERMSWNK